MCLRHLATRLLTMSLQYTGLDSLCSHNKDSRGSLSERTFLQVFCVCVFVFCMKAGVHFAPLLLFMCLFEENAFVLSFHLVYVRFGTCVVMYHMCTCTCRHLQGWITTPWAPPQAPPAWVLLVYKVIQGFRSDIFKDSGVCHQRKCENIVAKTIIAYYTTTNNTV